MAVGVTFRYIITDAGDCIWLKEIPVMSRRCTGCQQLCSHELMLSIDTVIRLAQEVEREAAQLFSIASIARIHPAQ